VLTCGTCRPTWRNPHPIQSGDAPGPGRILAAGRKRGRCRNHEAPQHRCRLSQPLPPNLLSTPRPARRDHSALRRPLHAPQRRSRSRHPSQLALSLEDLDLASASAGHLAPTPEQQVSTELASAGMDLQQHVLTPHLPELRRRGFTPAQRLLEVRTDVDVLVAGVRAATQTPPVRSGRRVVFLTVDDVTVFGVNVTVFRDVQATASHHLLYRASLLVTGRVRRTGPALNSSSRTGRPRELRCRQSTPAPAQRPSTSRAAANLAVPAS
jgi:hypothetical protein